MPRRAILSAVERGSLLALPNEPGDLIRHYTLNELDRSLIHQRRGDANRLGFAIQLCLLRYPGHGLSVDAVLPPATCAVGHWTAVHRLYMLPNAIKTDLSTQKVSP